MDDTIASDENPPRPPSNLELELDPKQLSFTLMKAHVAYRLILRNVGEASIISLRVHADLISAHASNDDDEQLRGPDMAHTQLQKIARIDPGETAEISGNIELAFAQVQLIHHGEKQLLLPLARFRLIGAGITPLIRAFVLGQPSPEDGRIRPFRLDSGTRLYDEIVANAVD